jgi:hypothetical protein
MQIWCVCLSVKLFETPCRQIERDYFVAGVLRARRDACADRSCLNLCYWLELSTARLRNTTKITRECSISRLIIPTTVLQTLCMFLVNTIFS